MKEISANLNQAQSIGGVQNTPSLNTAVGQANAALFKEALGSAQKVPIARPSGSGDPLSVSAASSSSLRFSNHAVDRMQARGVRFSPEQMGKIENAVSKAAEKGAKNCLLLSDEAALIVSVKDKTVVTVMDKNNLKENVFTNIDSTVMI